VTAGIKTSGNPDFAFVLADHTANARRCSPATGLCCARHHWPQTSESLAGNCGRRGQLRQRQLRDGAGWSRRLLQGLRGRRRNVRLRRARGPSLVDGIIGVPLPGEKLIAALPAVKAALALLRIT